MENKEFTFGFRAGGHYAYGPLTRSLFRSAFRACSSRGEHRPRPGRLHGCRLASHSEFAIDETDSTKQKSVPPPIAIAPIRCRVQCCAWRARARCGGHGDLAGLTPRHNHGRLTRSQDDSAVALARPARMGWHQPVRGLAANRYDWPR